MCILDSRQIPYIVYISRDLLYIVYILLETFQKISLILIIFLLLATKWPLTYLNKCGQAGGERGGDATRHSSGATTVETY